MKGCHGHAPAPPLHTSEGSQKEEGTYSFFFFFEAGKCGYTHNCVCFYAYLKGYVGLIPSGYYPLKPRWVFFFCNRGLGLGRMT